MKKYISFLLVAALFAACTPQNEVGTPFKAGQEVTLTAHMPNAGNNGAQQLPSKQRVSGKDTGTQIDLTWDTGDQIKVTVGDKSATFTLASGAGSAQATFTGVMPADGDSYSVQYPIADPDLSAQTYVKNGFGKDLMKMTTKTNGTLNDGFTLSADYTLLGLQLTGSDALGKMVLTNPADNKTFTLDCTDVTLNADDPTLFYIVVPVGTWANGFTVDIYADDNTTIIKTLIKTGSVSFSTNQTMSMPEQNVGSDTPGNMENGHEYVDLGLSVKWATCNVGATKPEECGNYFAWGEIAPKEEYNWGTYKWCEGTATTLTKYNNNSTKGVVDNITILVSADDAATANWGGKWRMPTDAEWAELCEQCTWSGTTQNDVQGILGTSKKNGNSIFLPLTGYMNGNELTKQNNYGCYWLSSLREDNTITAWRLHFNNTYPTKTSSYSRYYGYPVRPVCP